MSETRYGCNESEITGHWTHSNPTIDSVSVRSKIIAGFDLCWDYRIQWWQIQIRAGIKEKVKVRTKYTLTIYSLAIAPISGYIIHNIRQYS